MNEHRPNKARRALTAYGGYRTRRTEEFKQTSDALAPWEPTAADGSHFTAERRRPARPANVESDVIVPLLQSVAVAIAVSVAGLYLSMFFDLFAWHLSCFGGLLAGGIWFIAALFLGRDLLWIVESITTYDIDGDGVIGPPPVTELAVNVTDGADRIHKQYRQTLGVEPDRMVKFAEGVLAGRGMAVNAWTGSNGLFSRTEFDGLMAELERSGLVERENPGQSNSARRLTDEGREAFEQLKDGQV